MALLAAGREEQNNVVVDMASGLGRVDRIHIVRISVRWSCC
jgi:hypothetical protein